METQKSTKRSLSIRMVLPGKKKKNCEDDVSVNNNRVLITVSLVGSFSPLRLVVNEDDKVSTVIDNFLKMYARGGRLPVLGSNFMDFTLHASNGGSCRALNPSEEIGSWRGRNFVLCRKKKNQVGEAKSQIITRQQSRRWMACIL